EWMPRSSLQSALKGRSRQRVQILLLQALTFCVVVGFRGAQRWAGLKNLAAWFRPIFTRRVVRSCRLNFFNRFEGNFFEAQVARRLETPHCVKDLLQKFVLR